MKRRTFLKAALGAGAGLAVGLTPASAPAKLTIKRGVPLKIHENNSFTWGNEYQQYLDALDKNWEKWEKVFGRFYLLAYTTICQNKRTFRLPNNVVAHQYGNHPKEVAMLAENLRLWNEHSETWEQEALFNQWKRISMPQTSQSCASFTTVQSRSTAEQKATWVLWNKIENTCVISEIIVKPFTPTMKVHTLYLHSSNGQFRNNDRNSSIEEPASMITNPMNGSLPAQT